MVGIFDIDLTDLQTRVGQEETLKMIDNIKTFDNFMIGAIALAIMLMGSMGYSYIRNKKRPSLDTGYYYTWS